VLFGAPEVFCPYWQNHPSLTRNCIQVQHICVSRQSPSYRFLTESCSILKGMKELIKHGSVIFTNLVLMIIIILGSANLSSYGNSFGFRPSTLLTPSEAANDTGADLSAQLLVSSNGTHLLVWRSNDGLGLNLGSDFDLVFSRSEDGGTTWSPPAALNSNATADTAGDFHPRLATDGSGFWFVVWHSKENVDGLLGDDADILVSWSADDGRNWSAPAPVNSYAETDTADDFNPSIATDGSGRWIVVWETTYDLGGTIGNDQDIVMSISNNSGQSWTVASVLEPSAAGDTADDFLADLETDGDGNWIAAWSRYESASDLVVARSTDNGDTWASAVGLHEQPLETEGQDFGVELATDSEGSWIAVWESGVALAGTVGPDQDILFSRSLDDGATWTTPAALNTDAAGEDELDSVPRIVAAGHGRWLVAWLSENPIGGITGTDPDIHVAYTPDDGTTWSDPQPLAEQFVGDTGADSDVAVAVDAKGRWTFVWSSTEDVAGAGIDNDLMIAQVDQPEFWTRARPYNEDAEVDAGADLKARVATDGKGTWVAVWNASNRTGVDFDIFYSRSLDNGQTWSPTANLNTNASTDTGGDRNPFVFTDASGVWIALWDSGENLNGTLGTDMDILVSRSTDNGGTWSPPTALTPTATSDTGDDTDPIVTTDRLGNWIATWQTVGQYGGDFDTETAYSSNDGIDWSAAIPLNSNATTDSGDDFVPWITTDMNGLWVAVWFSNHDLGGTIGTDDDILFTVSTDNGMTWTDPATLNSNAAVDDAEDDDFDPKIVTDGAGNWLVVWHSEGTLGTTVGKDHDIFYSRSTDDTATWEPVAALNANADTDVGEDDFVFPATDRLGRWFVVWQSTDELGRGIGTDSDVVISSSEDAGQTWSETRPVSPDASLDSSLESSSSIVPGASSQWLISFHSNRKSDGTAGTDFDVYHLASSITPLAGLTLDAGPDQNAIVGSSVDLRDARVTVTGNPGILSVDINWGDGNQSIGSVDTSFGTILASHVYQTAGGFTVNVTVNSTSGFSASDSLLVTVVQRTSPTVVAAPTIPRSLIEGTELSGEIATFTDPDLADTHTATIDWGDGEVTAVTVDQQTKTVTGTHRYDDDGDLSVTVTVEDSQGEKGAISFPLEILNDIPVPGRGGKYQVAKDEELSIDMFPFADGGVNDTHSAEIDWGDGTGPEAVVIPPGQRFVPLKHRFSDGGNHFVMVDVTDDAGATGRGSFEVYVTSGFIQVPPLVMVDRQPGAGNLELQWEVQVGRVYQAQYSSAMGKGADNWINLGAIITASSPSVTITDTMPSMVAARFYRLVEITSPGVSTSPGDGSTGHPTTGSVFISLPEALNSSMVPSDGAVTALVNGMAVTVNFEVSSDRRSLSVSFDVPLPEDADVTVTINGTSLLGESGEPIDVDGDGNPGGSTSVSFSTSDAVRSILLVDDDGGDTDVEQEYLAALTDHFPNQFDILTRVKFWD
jgi:hypothetical protein